MTSFKAETEKTEAKLVVMKELNEIRINFMVAGVGGMGKSTFLKLFFMMYNADGSDFQFNQHQKAGKTLKIGEIGCIVLQASNVRIKVHLVDAPGFGDSIDNQHAINDIKRYLEDAHNEWTGMNKTTITRKEMDAQDRRIHCIFYFIPPHRMKVIDYEFIQQLSGLAPIVPIVAKADTMTSAERGQYLVEVRDQLALLQQRSKHSIMYDFGEDPEDTEFLPTGPREQTSPHICSSPLSWLAHSADLSTSQIAAQTNTAAMDTSLAASAALSEIDAVNYLHDHELGESPGLDSLAASALSDIFPADGCLQESATDPAAGPFGAPSVMSNEGGASYSEMVSQAEELLERPAPALPRIPNVFAVVCDLSENGLREYSWGTLEIYNKEHSDFRRLQELVFDQGTHLQRMRELTEEMSVALYRANNGQSAWLRKAGSLLVRWKDLINGFVLWFVWTYTAILVLAYLGDKFFYRLEGSHRHSKW